MARQLALTKTRVTKQWCTPQDPKVLWFHMSNFFKKMQQEFGIWCPDLTLGSLRITYYTSIHSLSLPWLGTPTCEKSPSWTLFSVTFLATFQFPPPLLLVTMATIYILDCTVLAMFLVSFLRLSDEF